MSDHNVRGLCSSQTCVNGREKVLGGSPRVFFLTLVLSTYLSPVKSPMPPVLLQFRTDERTYEERVLRIRKVNDSLCVL